MFSLDVRRNELPKGTMSLSSLVSVAVPSSSAKDVMVTRSHQRNCRLLQSWCRKFEEMMLRTDAAAVETPSGNNPVSDSDPVLFEEGLIVLWNVQCHTQIPTAEDKLINLMYYNVFRGLTKNIRALNLDLQKMLTWGYDSPFVTGQVDISTLAPDFRPTYLQQTVSHHPCFDIFPDPVVRDNAIMYWYVDMNPLEGRLCMALAGRYTWHELDLGIKRGCILWGEPDVAESWEVTEGFVKDWPFLVIGAVRLEAATNRYRALRGDPPIFFA